MGKYAGLGRYLDHQARDGEERVELTFEEIEEIIPGRLPASAHEHRAWWANTAKNHTQAQEGWLGVGWEVQDVDLDEQTVTFEAEWREEGEGMRIQPRSPDPVIRSKEAWKTAADDAAMNRFSIGLTKRSVDPVPKPFPLVSEDKRIVGDKTYAKMLDGGRIPYAVHSTISETVWLLQHVTAEHRFIIFGNDRRVPETWLDRFGHLADGIKFYFLEDRDELEVLKPEAGMRVVDAPEDDLARTEVDR